MILTGPEILKRLESGQIKIQPFSVDQLNPNSYNVTLGAEILVYSDAILDSKRKLDTQTIKIPQEGLILNPGRVYLAKTEEYTEASGVVPVMYGRSSAARLGISVTNNAGLGDTGYKGVWTMAITVAQPVRVYVGMKLAQLVFFDVKGDVVEYAGKYQNSLEAVASKLNQDNS